MKLSNNKEKRIEQIKQAVTPLFKKHGIIKASLFGSVLRDDFDDDKLSDIDFLVEFDPQVKLSLFKLGGLYTDVSEACARDIDIVLNGRVRTELENYIYPTAVKIYE